MLADILLMGVATGFIVFCYCMAQKKRYSRKISKAFFTSFFLTLPLMVSGLLLSWIGFLLNLLLSPWNMDKYKKQYILNAVGEVWFCGVTFTCISWNGTRFRILRPRENGPGFESLTAEEATRLYLKNYVLFVNHNNTDLDALPHQTLFQMTNFGVHGCAWVKKLFLCIPPLGWMAWLQGSLFLDRNFDKDKQKIINWCSTMVSSFPKPTVISLFPEGTRNKPKTFLQAREFAKEREYTVPNHLLLPRVKGPHLLINSLRECRGAPECGADDAEEFPFQILRFALVNFSPKPLQSYECFFFGEVSTKVIEMIITDVKLAMVPEDIDAFGSWLRKRWSEMDEDMDRLKTGEFDNHQSWDVFSLRSLMAGLLNNFIATFCVFSLFFRFHWCAFYFAVGTSCIVADLIQRGTLKLPGEALKSR